jgi:hypothetical protein
MKHQQPIGDRLHLDEEFYNGYDADYFFRKARLFWSVVDTDVSLKTPDSEALDVDKQLATVARTELYFVEFHQFEALFALLTAAFQDLPHWVYLTKYTTRQMKAKIQAFAEGDFATTSNNMVDNFADFIRWSVYSGYQPEEEKALHAWQASLDNVNWLLKTIAGKYLDATTHREGEYNAYKHGLRIKTGYTSLAMIPLDQAVAAEEFESDDTIVFLGLERTGNKWEVYYRWKQFNPEQSYLHVQYMHLLQQAVKRSRLARIRNEIDTEMSLPVIIEVDRTRLVQLHARKISLRMRIGTVQDSADT